MIAIRSAAPRLGALLCALFAFAAPAAHAALTATPLTWNVVGLDSNSPASGPKNFPVGARVCTDVATTNVSSTFNWTSANAFVNIRPTSLTTINLGSIAAGACKDAYFEIEVTPNAAAYDTTRRYTITATDASGTASTPVPRELYVERLISQNRNAITNIRYGLTPATLQPVAPGGSMSLVVGNTYTIELTGGTATQGYEQFEAFINFTNTIFQILAVSTSYSADTSPFVPNPNDKLYADACGWDNNPNSPTYRNCVGAAAKAGGSTVVSTYTIRIIGGGGSSQQLNTLLYDFSGSSFHYNADYGVGGRIANIIDPATATIAKSFAPNPSSAGGISVLAITLGNPNGGALDGYNFSDPLPAGMTIAATPNATTSGCGTPTLTAPAGGSTISFANGTVAANGTCVIRVNVTTTGAGNFTNTTNNLFVGTVDTGKTATATLTVTNAPPPPPGLCGITLARWNFETGFNPGAPAPTVANVTAQASPGAGLSPQTSTLDNTITPAGTGSWSSNGAIATGTPLNTTNNDYFEFAVNTASTSQVTVSFDVRRQNNGPRGVALYYGTSASPPGTQDFANDTFLTAAGTNWTSLSRTIASGLNPTGLTYFRVYGYASNNTNPGSDLNIDNFLVTGCGQGQPATIAKAFAPNPIAINGTSTLAFTLTNPNTASLTGAAFTDALPSGTQVAATPAAATTCGGAWTPAAGNTTLSFSGGTIPASGTCTVSVNVTATTAGPKSNVSSFLQTTETGTNTNNVATATLNVLAPPSISKTFLPSPIVAGGISKLRFDIVNPNPNSAISGVAFGDTFPTTPGAMVVAPTPNATNAGCGTPTWAPVAGAGSVALSGATIAAGGTCTVTVDVRAPNAGTYTNTSGNVSFVLNAATINGNTASAQLVATAPNPSLTLLKQVATNAAGPWSSTLAVAPGANVFYRFTIENTGDVALSTPTLNDPLVGTAGCTLPATLPVASIANDNHIAVCTVGPIVAVAGVNPNTATATAAFSGNPVSDTSTATYATTGLTLDKNASPATYTAAGNVVSYTFLVTNSGFIALAGPITVNDPLTSDEACPAVTTVGDLDAFLDPGESITCTATYTITAADVIARSVTNTATATNGTTTSNPDSTTITIAEPQLAVTKTATPNPFVVGQAASYSIVVQNNGTAPSSANITISDALPAGITLAGATGTSWSCTGTTNLSCTFTGTLAAGASTTLTLNVNVAASAANGNNTATASGGGDPGCPAAARCAGTIIVPVTAPQLVVTKSATPATFVVGQPASYTIGVQNSGTAATTAAITVADTLPTGITLTGFAGAGWLCTGTTNLSCTFAGPLAAGASTALTLNVAVAANATNGDNSATASGGGDPGCPAAARCTGTVTVPVTAPQLTVTKTATPATFVVGQPASYAIAVQNTGTAATTANITIADTLPTGITLASATGASWTCTGPTALSCAFAGTLAVGATTTLTLNVNVAASATNGNNSATAAGGGDPGCPAAARCTGTIIVPVNAPQLTVTKTATPAAFVIGQPASYSIAVQNTGTATTVGNIIVADTLPAGITLTGATGASWTCTGTTTLSCTFTGTLAAGATTTLTLNVAVAASATNGDNSATASGGGDPTCPAAARCTGTIVVPVSAPQLTVTKTATPATFVVGQAAGYAVTVRNSGSATTSGNITIADTLPTGITLTSATGTSWTCTGTSTLSCTFTGTLAPAATTTLTLNVSVDASATNGDNSATASGGGDPTCPASARCTGTVVVPITAPQLTVTKTATPASFVVGNPASYAITVQNSGTAATVGNITVADTLPPGITLTGATGASWTCAGTSTLSCTFAGTLAPSASATLTLNVSVGAAATTGTNTATASGGGDPGCPASARCSGTIIVPVAGAVDLAIAKSHTGTFTQGQLGVQYTIVVSNVGGSGSVGVVSVTDTPPAGITATAIAGPGWACALATLTCTRSDALAAGASHPPITLTADVSSAALGSLVNTAVVSGGGDGNPTNNTATDGVTITPLGSPDLAAQKTHTGTLVPGQAATYQLLVRNVGSAATSGLVTVTDTLPAGLTAVSLSGTGWTCSVAPLACTRSDSLAAGAQWPAITLVANVAANASGTLQNVMNVTGGGDTTPPNNTSSDPAVIQGAAPRVVVPVPAGSPASLLLLALGVLAAGAAGARRR